MLLRVLRVISYATFVCQSILNCNSILLVMTSSTGLNDVYVLDICNIKLVLMMCAYWLFVISIQTTSNRVRRGFLTLEKKESHWEVFESKDVFLYLLVLLARLDNRNSQVDSGELDLKI